MTERQLPPPSDAVIQLSGVRVVRAGTAILDEVSWTVREGERWVLLGPNGAGKTTLLSLLSAQLHPTAGVVQLLDERLGAVDVFELRPRIGVAGPSVTKLIPPSARALDVVLTAAYGATARWRERYDDLDLHRARHLLTYLGCSAFADRRFDTLSEGERQRVLIARALMTDPELLLLDEPAAGLDLGAREALVMRLSRLAADAAAPTMVVVTHHVEEIPEGFSHALLLGRGRVVAAGSVHDVLTPERLTSCFGIPLAVEHRDGRWAARVARRMAAAG